MKKTFKYNFAFLLITSAALYTTITAAKDPVLIELSENPVFYSDLKEADIENEDEDEDESNKKHTIEVADTDFKQYLPANEEWVHCTFKNENKKIRIIEFKTLSPIFKYQFVTFKQSCSADEISWSGMTSYLSRARFLTSREGFKEDFMECNLKGVNDSSMEKETIRPIVTNFTKQLMQTSLYLHSQDRVEELMTKHLAVNLHPQYPIEIFVVGPASGSAFGRLHTENDDKDKLLAQAFLANERPTTIFPLVLTEEKIDYQPCFNQCSMNCFYHTLLKHGHGFSAPASMLLIASGAVAHSGPDISNDDKINKRILMGARIFLSKQLLSALNAAGKRSQFIAEYWEDFM